MGTDERTVGISYEPHSYLQRKSGATWVTVAEIYWWPGGAWRPSEPCHEIRDFELNFEPVALVPGENRFRIFVYIPECEEYHEDWIYSEEFVYTYVPAP